MICLRERTNIVSDAKGNHDASMRPFRPCTVIVVRRPVHEYARLHCFTVGGDLVAIVIGNPTIDISGQCNIIINMSDLRLLRIRRNCQETLL